MLGKHIKTIEMLRILKKLFFTVILTFLMTGLRAQVWPGDVNGNGEVNNVDMLYLGYAFGEIGPKRLETGTDWTEQFLPVAWNKTFPDGVNYAHADCNGDGLIDVQDLLVIIINFGFQNDNFEPDTFTPGLESFDPELYLDPTSTPTISGLGSTIDGISLQLGTIDIPVENFMGIAFTVTYNPVFVKEGSVKVVIDSSWMNNEPSSLFYGQDLHSDGSLQVGLSRYGLDPVSGEGQIAKLSFIIEDNLVGLTVDTVTTIVCLENIKVINEFMEEVPIVGDCLEIGVFDPDYVTSTSNIPDKGMRIYPNPASNHLFLDRGKQAIQQLRVIDALGRTRMTVNDILDLNRIDLEVLENGLYYLEVFTNEGSRTYSFIKK